MKLIRNLGIISLLLVCVTLCGILLGFFQAYLIDIPIFLSGITAFFASVLFIYFCLTLCIPKKFILLLGLLIGLIVCLASLEINYCAFKKVQYKAFPQLTQAQANQLIDDYLIAETSHRNVYGYTIYKLSNSELLFCMNSNVLKPSTIDIGLGKLFLALDLLILLLTPMLIACFIPPQNELTRISLKQAMQKMLSFLLPAYF